MTVICGNCEFEWSADKLAGDADCPVCGMAGDLGEHIVRSTKREQCLGTPFCHGIDPKEHVPACPLFAGGFNAH